MTIADFYRALWRHRFFIVFMTIAVGVLAWFLATRQTKLYTASTLVRVQQSITSAGEAFGALQTGERLARTYATIVETRTIADGVGASLRGSVPRSDIVIDATQLPNLELLQVSVTNESPARAALIANAVPAALEDFIKQTGTLRDQVVTIERATIPSEPSSPNVPLTVALAVIAGLVLNSGLAVMLEALSGRFRSVEDVEHLGYPVVATIPTLSRRRLRAAHQLDHAEDGDERLFTPRVTPVDATESRGSARA